MTCPHCRQPLPQPHPQRCPSCRQRLEELSSQRYGRPVSEIRQALERLRKGQFSQTAVKGLMPQLMGRVSHILDQAADDLGQNIRDLKSLETETSLDLMEDFGDIQDAMHQTLDQISDLFRRCTDLEEFEALLPRIESSLNGLEEGIDSLGSLYLESTSEAALQPPSEPLPAEVSQALESFEVAMKAIVEYMDQGRDESALARCVTSAEEATSALKSYLSRSARS